MQATMLRTKKGRLYLLFLTIAGALLVLAPFLAWLYYNVECENGGLLSNVSVIVTGFGSLTTSNPIIGVTYVFPPLQGWWYGDLTMIVGALVVVDSLLVLYRPETAGLIAFLLSFINIPTSLFFLGRLGEIEVMVLNFVSAIQGAGYTIVGTASGYAIGFYLEVIGTFLLPIASVFITTNAAKLKQAAEKEEDKRKKLAEQKTLLE